MALKMLGDHVLVKPDAEEATRGGILLPDTAREKPQRGTVVSVGEGRRLDNGKLVPLSVKVGDRVIFSKYGGTEVKEDGEEYLVMGIDSILAKDA
jgi:chaperonin GroES